MNTFQPSGYSGADEAGASEEDPGYDQLLAQYAPAVSQVLFGSDPREQYEKKKANLKTFKLMYANANNNLLRGVYAAKIRNLQGEIKALEERVGEERSAVALTQTGKVGGIFALVAGGAAALMVANYFRQKAKTEKWHRTHSPNR